MRYVPRTGTKQSSAGGTTYVSTYRRCLRQPWIASPHIITTCRECDGGFAMTGRAYALPPPRARRGVVPRRSGRLPPQRTFPRRSGRFPAAADVLPPQRTLTVAKITIRRHNFT
ncbi:MAG: hypothetical protein LBM98_02985 [Oscillospiraceae bacterium]|nr:hypothetical protein [Oscillospiraceae bacterium]